MTKARDLANVISGSGTLNAAVIPALPASKITSGTLGADRVPDLATSKITSGTFADDRLSSSSVTQHVDLTALSASNLTSGTVPSARLSLGASDIPALATSKITSGTFADARFAASNITQHVDLSNLNASNLTSGTVPDARVSSSSVTAHVSATTSTHGSWTPSCSSGGFSSTSGRYYRVGDLVVCWGVGKFTSSPASNTNVWFIQGLPFTSRNDGDTAGHAIVNIWRAGGHQPKAWVVPNSTSIRMGNQQVPLTSTYSYNAQYSWNNVITNGGSEGMVVNNIVMRNSVASDSMFGVEVVYQV